MVIYHPKNGEQPVLAYDLYYRNKQIALLALWMVFLHSIEGFGVKVQKTNLPTKILVYGRILDGQKLDENHFYICGYCNRSRLCLQGGIIIRFFGVYGFGELLG